MKKLFGEFLIERNLVTPQALVTALVQQASKVPSTIEIALTSKLLSDEQILQAMNLQIHRSIEFVTACKELGSWNAEVQEKMEGEVRKAKVPLGEILVEQKDIELKTLIESLDTFLTEVAEQKEEVTEQTQEATSSPTEFNPEFTEPNKSGLASYSDSFTEKKRQTLSQLLEFTSWQDSDEQKKLLSEQLEELQYDFHQFQGIACFLKIEISEQIFRQCELVFSSTLGKLDNVNQEQIEKVRSITKNALLLTESLETSIFDTGSEKDFWQNGIFQEQTLSLFQDVSSYLAA